MYGKRILDRQQADWTPSRTAWRRRNWREPNGSKVFIANAPQDPDIEAATSESNEAGGNVEVHAETSHCTQQRSEPSIVSVIECGEITTDSDDVYSGMKDAPAHAGGIEDDRASTTLHEESASHLESSNANLTPFHRGSNTLSNSPPAHDDDLKLSATITSIDFTDFLPLLPGSNAGLALKDDSPVDSANLSLPNLVYGGSNPELRCSSPVRLDAGDAVVLKTDTSVNVAESLPPPPDADDFDLELRYCSSIRPEASDVDDHETGASVNVAESVPPALYDDDSDLELRYTCSTRPASPSCSSPEDGEGVAEPVTESQPDNEPQDALETSQSTRDNVDAPDESSSQPLVKTPFNRRKSSSDSRSAETSESSVLSIAQQLREAHLEECGQTQDATPANQPAPGPSSSFSDACKIRLLQQDRQWRSGRLGTAWGLLNLHLEIRTQIYDAVLAAYCKAADAQDDWLRALNLLYTSRAVRDEFRAPFTTAVSGLPFRFELGESASRLEYVRWLHAFGVGLGYAEQVLHEPEKDEGEAAAAARGRVLKMSFRAADADRVDMEVFCKCRESETPCQTETHFVEWVGRAQSQGIGIRTLGLADIVTAFGGAFARQGRLSGFLVVQRRAPTLPSQHDGQWVAGGEVRGFGVKVLGRCTSR